MNRKAIQQIVKSEGIEKAMRLPKGALTAKQKRFAEAVALGNTGADSLRIAYNSKAKPKAVGDMASRLKSDVRIKAEIERIERAQELAALHSAAGLKSIVISTLAEIATSTEEKGAVRVQAVRAIGQLVGVDAFRETKRVEHVKDSGEIRAQILDQLKTMMLGTADAETVDADSLLVELAGDEPHPDPTPAAPEWDSAAHVHSNEHIPPPSFSDPDDSTLSPRETPPSSAETDDPRGDIFGENDDVTKL
jgi:hypothetical protein